MKKFIVLFMALVAMCVTTAKAQSSLLATLNHEGTITTFYGTTALQKAHESAADGDVITLSSGTFQSVDITKAITLRGAGMSLDVATQTEPTVLVSDFNITISEESTQRLTIEGIYANQTVIIKHLKNAMFLKDRFRTISTYSSNGIAKDLTFIHCRITEGYSANTSSDNSAVFHNCIVQNVGGRNYIFKNCLFLSQGDNYSTWLNEYFEYRNCIILNAYKPVSNSTFYNNLYCSGYNLTNTNNTNVKVDKNDEAIKNLFGYSDDKNYKLTEAAKALIKGTDGTEVSIYGGSLPYSPVPTNPQISKFNVAAKTTADGKLSVDIEVKSAE